MQEHFGEALRSEQPEAWQAGHGRLFEHLQTVPEKDQPDTLAKMAPLFQAVHHGCAAGRHQEVLEKVYGHRITRLKEQYLTKRLGAWSLDLCMSSLLFAKLWAKPHASLDRITQGWLLNNVAYVLKSLGQLPDALEPLHNAVDRAVEEQRWLSAATRCNNLSELYLNLGNIGEAVSWGQMSIAYADQDGDVEWRIAARANLANCWHHQYNLEAARVLFEEAEEINAKHRPPYPKLISLAGFYYRDFLLSFNNIQEVNRRIQGQQRLFPMGGWTLLDNALIRLSQGQAADASANYRGARSLLDQAVDRLRTASAIEFVPNGLLARAAVLRKMEEFALSRRDLDEAMRIAKRGEMLLHQCDAHLGYARLARNEGRPDVAREPLANAERLVNETGYHRRDSEVQELRKTLGPDT